MNDKQARLRELACLRKNAEWPRARGYKCIGDYHRGKYECDFVSPYTRGACNVNSDLMILLQDWAPDERLNGPYLHARVTVGHDPSRPTNKRLRELLRQYFRLELEQVYATNVFPFIRVDKIWPEDFVRAAKEFALPQIEIVGPRLAVCLGKAAFNAVALAAGRRPAESRAAAIASPFAIGKTEVWCQAHPARNSVQSVAIDWVHMKSAYDRGVKQAGAFAAP